MVDHVSLYVHFINNHIIIVLYKKNVIDKNSKFGPMMKISSIHIIFINHLIIIFSHEKSS